MADFSMPKIPKRWTNASILSFVVLNGWSASIYLREGCPECIIVCAGFTVILVGSAMMNIMPMRPDGSQASGSATQAATRGSRPEVGAQVPTTSDTRNFVWQLMSFLPWCGVAIACLYFCPQLLSNECTASDLRSSVMTLLTFSALLIVALPLVRRLLKTES